MSSQWWVVATSKGCVCVCKRTHVHVQVAATTSLTIYTTAKLSPVVHVTGPCVHVIGLQVGQHCDICKLGGREPPVVISTVCLSLWPVWPATLRYWTFCRINSGGLFTQQRSWWVSIPKAQCYATIHHHWPVLAVHGSHHVLKPTRTPSLTQFIRELFQITALNQLQIPMKHTIVNISS